MSRRLLTALSSGVVVIVAIVMLQFGRGTSHVPVKGTAVRRPLAALRSTDEVATRLPSRALEQPAGDLRAESLQEWTEREPAAAWRWAMARLSKDDPTWQRVLAWIAQKDLPLACEYAAQLVQDCPELAQIAHSAVLDTLAQDGDYASAAGVLELLPEGEVKGHLVTNLALQWGRDDPLAAAEWLIGLPSAGIDRRAAFADLGRSWAEVDPQAAAEVLLRLPTGELRQRSLTAALSVWIEKDPTAASAWLVQLAPHPDLDLAAARIARVPSLVQTHVDVALGWAERIVDSNERLQALGSIVALWADTDRAAAVRFVQTSPALTSAQRASLLEDTASDLLAL